MGARDIRIIVAAWIRIIRIRGGLFFAGFFSKHSLFGEVYSSRRIVLFSVLVFGRVFTCIYRARLANTFLNQNKTRTFSPKQGGLMLCYLIGSSIVAKLLWFETEFTKPEFGVFSFLFLVWFFWRWVLFGEHEVTSRIFYSLILTPNQTNFVLAPSFLDSGFSKLNYGVSFFKERNTVI